jgi:hypothetical protein
MIPLPAVPTAPLAQSCSRLYAQIGAQLNQLQQLLANGTNLIWNNPAASPQAVVAAMGANAGSIFQLSGLVCGLIGAVTGAAPNPVPAGWSVVINADNTVTLTPPSAPSTS